MYIIPPIIHLIINVDRLLFMYGIFINTKYIKIAINTNGKLSIKYFFTLISFLT